ncbi:glycosyltransferase [Idiomarina sp. HB]|uniref:glycosyltransferase n=1 Tax=Idiomarina sp. HB TaxID=3110479 RepID=UPI003A7FC60D
MNDKTLCVAISTIGDLSSELLEKLEGYTSRLNSGIDFLVISQKARRNHFLDINPRLRIIFSTDIGLSKSRNLAINESKCSWIWFQDDDIDLNIPSVNRLYFELTKFDPDFCCLKIASSEDHSKPFKNYSFLNWSTPLKAMKISSIELVVRKCLIQGERYNFDPNLGLGTSLPSCEENLFFYNFLLKGNGKINQHKFDEYVAYHTTDLDVRNLDHTQRVKARGFFLSKIKFIHAFPLLLYWSLRKERKGITNRLKRSKALLEGYRQGLDKESTRL